tara:strand:+ start:281 stop:1393 length:1113 start_codon:yes stop_codon:yes gene_type:complete
LKDSEVIDLANKAGYEVEIVEPIVQEASQRQYYRIYTSKDADLDFEDRWNNPKIFILCYLDPQIGSHDKTVAINAALIRDEVFGLAPKILFHDQELGITIQEDIGEEYLYDLYEKFGPPESEHYHEYSYYGALEIALNLLDKIRRKKIPNLKKIQNKDLSNQMKTFESIYLQSFLCISPFEIALQRENLQSLIDETINNLELQPWVNCHTDFEGRNILITPDFDWDDMFVIDYQDMCIGPVGIDLAGVIFDHYYFKDFNIDKIKECLLHEFDVFGLLDNRYDYPYDKETKEKIGNDIYEYARWGAIQRNMRILGTLSNLYIKDNRSFRLPDLELVLSNLIQIIPDDHAQLKKFFKNTVLTTNNKRVKEII